ncbi:MAG: O-antigen ligase family protein [Bacteroidetes bacterium]|nr:O-antigen ligase family protein [Bacteroidota bacterium]
MKTSRIIAVIFVWVAFTSEYPFTLIQAYPWHPHLLIISTINLLMVTWLLVKKNFVLLSKKVLVVITIQVIIFFIFFMIHNDEFYLRIILRMIPIVITCIFIKNIIGIENFSKSLLVLFSILGILGVAAFILSFIGILDPIYIYENPDGRPAYNFIFTLTNKVFQFGNTNVIRVASFFDEPGTFAFYIIFFLLLNKIYKFGKVYDNILIISGLFTFSMAFYILIAVYFIIFRKEGKRRYYIPAVLVIIAFLSIVFISKGESDVSNKMYSLTFDRFRMTNNEDQLFVGDNRSRQMFMAISIFLDNPLIGYGTTNAIKDFPPMNTNIFAPLAFNGVIGFIFLFMNVGLLYSFIYKRKDTAKFILLLTLLYFQRPHVIGYFTYSMTILIVEMIINERFNKTHYQKSRIGAIF